MQEGESSLPWATSSQELGFPAPLPKKIICIRSSQLASRSLIGPEGQLAAAGQWAGMLESSARRPSTAVTPGGVSGACPGRVGGRVVPGTGRARGGAFWRAIEAGDPGAAGEDSGRAAGTVSPSPPLHCAAQDPPEVGDGARVHRGEEPSRAGASQDRAGARSPLQGSGGRAASTQHSAPLAHPAPSPSPASRELSGVPPASAPHLPAAQVCPAWRCRRVPGRAGPLILRGGPGGGRGE